MNTHSYHAKDDKICGYLEKICGYLEKICGYPEKTMKEYHL